MTARKQPIADRMERYVDRSGGPDACWPWLAYRNADGYGTIEVDGQSRLAHCVAWEQENGRPVPPGVCVLHDCDNPPCCNPRHLWDGTKAENNADRDRKGRAADRRGEKAAGAKLTEDKVREIRAATGTRQQIAGRFGVSSSAVTLIIQRKRWPHVRDIQPAPCGGNSSPPTGGNSAHNMPAVLP